MRTPILVVLLVIALGAAVAVAVERDDEQAAAERLPPVVVLILDEFATDALTLPGGRLDAARFPNFAALAGTSTWFRNGVTVYDSTFKAVPSILDARMPRPRTAADIRSHQPNVFHLMYGLGYDVVKVESASALCPPWICQGTRTRRPGVLARLAGNGRPARLHRWIGAIRDTDTPRFYLHHALLPHEPWIYLPSGRQSRPPGNDPIPGINKPIGWHDRGLTDHNHLRYLLQVGYTDLALGRLMARMRRTGVWNRSLLIVVADHGYSFDLNVKSRRQVTESNIEEVATVPFFVKLPGQTTGEVDDRIVRNVDVVPTIADVLNVDVPWEADGRSAFSQYTLARRQVSMARRDFSRVVTMDVEPFEQAREEARRRWAAKFGTGPESQKLFGDPWATAYRIGPHPNLLGDRIRRTLPVSRDVRGDLANAHLLRDVDPGERLYPTRVVGRLEGSPPEAQRDLAVAVNGRIQAVGRSFHLRGRRPELFSLIVPEPALREGRNRLELLEVQPDGDMLSLLRVS